MKKDLLLGNEAIAWGAVLAGVNVVTGYPGTPSSEIVATLANLAADYGYYVEWSVNEKVALEVAAGASYSGARSIVTMKQVGLNVAADPMMTLAYIGVKGGLVIVSADDPGPHSSQNEQDTRTYARMAKLPVLEPSDPEEALRLTVEAFELSEKFSIPVILRPTTRLCHGSGPVSIDREKARAIYQTTRTMSFEKDSKWVIFPALSRRRHQALWDMNREFQSYFGTQPFLATNIAAELANSAAPESGAETGSGSMTGGASAGADAQPRYDLGIVCCGVSRRYVMEALAAKSGGTTYPILEVAAFPINSATAAAFMKRCRRILVVEEGDPLLEEELALIAQRFNLDTEISGRRDGKIPPAGELNADLVSLALFGSEMHLCPCPCPDQHQYQHQHPHTQQHPHALSQEGSFQQPDLPVRPPVLCAGCPHRASFYIWGQAARKHRAIFTGDIGCYTLGNAQPLDAVDTCLCMGASYTLAQGLKLAEPDRPVVAFLGDSTFFHSGIPGLVNAVYNDTPVKMVVLDNSTTAMTGNQPNPGMGRTLAGKQTVKIDPLEVAKACGVQFVREVDPFDLRASVAVASEALQYPGPALIVMRQPCATLLKHSGRRARYAVNSEHCTNCGVCLRKLGCPALVRKEGKVFIGDSCTGCSICAQICPSGSIREVQGNEN